jgi:hypothetical protein
MHGTRVNGLAVFAVDPEATQFIAPSFSTPGQPLLSQGKAINSFPPSVRQNLCRWERMERPDPVSSLQ